MTKKHIPKYRHQKSRNLGVVRLSGRDHYLGEYDSPESWDRYWKLIAEFPCGAMPLSLVGIAFGIAVSPAVAPIGLSHPSRLRRPNQVFYG